jgi:hypothetical protein
MNNLQHIRSMAELILKQVDELEGTPAYSIPAYSLSKRRDPKFKVGDKVIWQCDNGRKTGTVSRIAMRMVFDYRDGDREIVQWYTVWCDDRSINEDLQESVLTLLEPETKPEVKKTTRVWHSGVPPHIGWWNASNAKCPATWRWWNGAAWSVAAYEGNSAEQVEHKAQTPLEPIWCEPTDIYWSDYWPANACVPRIDPENNTDLR